MNVSFSVIPILKVTEQGNSIIEQSKMWYLNPSFMECGKACYIKYYSVLEKFRILA